MPTPTIMDNEQQRHFHQEGYLVLENIISGTEIENLKNAALQIVDDFDIDKHRSVFTTNDRDTGRDDYFFDSAQNVHCFLEEGALDAGGHLLKPARLAINKIGHAMHDLNPVFTHFCRQPLFAGLMKDIGYSEPSLWQTMYIFKQPRIGGEVRWHQDASYLISESPGVVGLWIAIEDAHRDNGCLWVQPGGHRSALREIYEVDWDKREGRLSTLDQTPWPGHDEAVAVEVPKGSVVMFHSRMPHYSSQNRSNHSRHAFTMHFLPAQAGWSDKNWIQRPQLGQFII